MSNEGDRPIIFQDSSDPGVIHQDLLIDLVINQGPHGQAGKLFKEDGIKLDEVKEIRIEFLSKQYLN